jgi:hypothetical protein
MFQSSILVSGVGNSRIVPCIVLVDLFPFRLLLDIFLVTRRQLWMRHFHLCRDLDICSLQELGQFALIIHLFLFRLDVVKSDDFLDRVQTDRIGRVRICQQLAYIPVGYRQQIHQGHISSQG